MKILKMDGKNGVVEVVAHGTEDLWVLRKFIKPGDVISSVTTRSIKPPGATRFEKKTLYLEVEVERAEFHEYSGELRVSGIILSGRPAELVEPKAHHTIEVSPGRRVRITKKPLHAFEIDMLKEAQAQSSVPRLAVVLLDDELADIATFSNAGFSVRTRVHSHKSGKQYASDQKDDYYARIASALAPLDLPQVLVAGPGFAKEHLQKELSPKGFEVFVESAHSVGPTGFSELSRKGIPLAAFEQSHARRENELLERFLAELGRNTHRVAYGFDAVKNALLAGAATDLLVSEERLLSERTRTEELAALAKRTRARITFFARNQGPGDTLESYSGYAALLRYPLETA